jgi:hypothetical protein
MNREWRHDGYVISADASHLEIVHSQEFAVLLMR